jgi:hypothetical protein
MSRIIQVSLSEGAYAELEREARATGASLSEQAAAILEERFGRPWPQRPDGDRKQSARERFEQHFGEVDLGHPTGTDNEAIDRDIVNEYAQRRAE